MGCWYQGCMFILGEFFYQFTYYESAKGVNETDRVKKKERSLLSMKCFIKDEELFMPAQVVFYFLCGQKPQWYLKSFSAFRMIVVNN